MVEQVLVILRRRKWLFIIPFTVVFLIPVIHAYLYARSYEADSTVWLDSDLGASSAVQLQSGSQESTPMSPEWNQTASERAEQEPETYEIVKKMHELDKTVRDGRAIQEDAEARKRLSEIAKEHLEQQIQQAGKQLIQFCQQHTEATKQFQATWNYQKPSSEELQQMAHQVNVEVIKARYEEVEKQQALHPKVRELRKEL